MKEHQGIVSTTYVNPRDKLYAGRVGDYGVTFTGKRIYPLDPSYMDFDIFDIAHGLSHICRYAGQCVSYYSVAEHSVRGSARAEQAFGKAVAKEFLLHDAAEAFIGGDMIGPFLKYAADYRRLRDNIQGSINLSFGLPFGMTEECKVVDEKMLVTEGPTMFPDSDDRWWENARYPKPYADEFDFDRDGDFLNSVQAKAAFLRRWSELREVKTDGLR